jgi:hypothetical protein
MMTTMDAITNMNQVAHVAAPSPWRSNAMDSSLLFIADSQSMGSIAFTKVIARIHMSN